MDLCKMVSSVLFKLMLVSMSEVQNLGELERMSCWTLTLFFLEFNISGRVLVETYLDFLTFFSLTNFLFSALSSLFSSLIFFTVSSKLLDF